MNQRAYTMATILGVAGVTHCVRPAFFDAIVPPPLKNKRFWTYASGAAELSCAAMLANPSTRQLGGLCTAALMVGVFPANVYTVTKVRGSRTARAIAIARLPLQMPLVTTSLQIADGTDAQR